MVDLIDRVETTRFLGAEFLAWLWFKSELDGGRLEVPSGAFELVFESPLQLVDWVVETESATLKGKSPTEAPEANMALREGKLPRKVVLLFTFGSEETRLTFDSKKFAMSGVKLPAVMSTEDADEGFFERMRLLDHVDAVLRELYAEFLRLRLSPLWESELLGVIREWVRGKLTITPRAYSGLLARATRGKK